MTKFMHIHVTTPPQPCLWFALCENDATHLEPHPILGPVPCCDRCAKIGK